MKITGIYSIENSVTGKRYVGSAVDIKHRWLNHLGKLRKNTHHSIKLQNSWNKHGSTVFVFAVLEEVKDNTDLLQREQFWINHFNCAEVGYNINAVAGSSRGTPRGPRSEETKAKISAAQKGKTLSPEHLSALRNAVNPGMTGKKQSEHFKKRMSEVHSGKIVSEETRAKMSASLKGRTSYVRPFRELYFAALPDFMKAKENDSN